MTLALRGVERRYGPFVLGPLDATFDDGVTAVLGPSGCGKTTLLQLVAGFETPTAGTVRLNGRRLDGLAPEDRNVGMVFQSAALFRHLTVRENVAYGADGADRVRELCDLLAVGDLLDRAPGTLSGGERQRVALARALAADPDALLLDEPLSGLDAPIRRRLRLELRDVLADLDLPVVYVTHDRAEATAVGDAVAVMRDGSVVQSGPLAAVFEAPATPFVADFLGYENHLRGPVVGERGGRAVVDAGPARVAVAPGGAVPDGEAVVALRPGALSVAPADEEPPLPEAFDPPAELEPLSPPAARESPTEPPSPNRLSATVRRAVRRPTGTTLLLSWPGGGDLRASVEGTDRFAAGDAVVVGFDPADAKLLPGES